MFITAVGLYINITTTKKYLFFFTKEITRSFIADMNIDYDLDLMRTKTVQTLFDEREI